MQRQSSRKLAAVLISLLSLALAIGSFAPLASAASPSVTSSGTVLVGASNCNPQRGTYTVSFNCSVAISATSGDLVVAVFQVAYYGGEPGSYVSLSDSMGTSFKLTAHCVTNCYTMNEGFETGIYYGLAQSSGSDTITMKLTNQDYGASNAVASATIEAYDVSFAGISGTPGLSSNAYFNCQYQDFYGSNPGNVCYSNGSTSVPMTPTSVASQSYGSGAFLVAGVLTTGPGVSGGSGFTFVSTKCVNANYCYGAEYGTPDTVTSPTSFPFSAQAPSGVYWGWVESAAVFTASSGLRSSGPPPTNFGNETISAVPLGGSSSGYDITVVAAAAVVGLIVGAVVAMTLTRRKPGMSKPPMQP